MKKGDNEKHKACMRQCYYCKNAEHKSIAKICPEYQTQALKNSDSI